jgi:hypothetical protein
MDDTRQGKNWRLQERTQLQRDITHRDCGKGRQGTKTPRNEQREP